MVSPIGEPLDFEVIQPFNMVPVLIEPPEVELIPVMFDTGELSPFGPSQRFHVFNIPDTKKAAGDVLFAFTMVGDLENTDVETGDYILVSFNGQSWSERPFLFDGKPCDFGVQTTTMTLTADQWNAIITPGETLVMGVFSITKFRLRPCENTFVRVKVDYDYAEERDDPPYIGWRSFGEVLPGGGGDPHVQEGEWRINPDGELVVMHKDDSNRVTYSGAAAARVGEDGEPVSGEPGHACLMSPTTGEVPGVIVNFTTSTPCPRIPDP